MGARHCNHLYGFVSVAILLIATLTGCRPDRCRGEAPAFELELILPAGVDGTRVAELSVEVLADGQRRKKETLAVRGELGDGQSTLSADVKSAGVAGFVVEVVVEARDSDGRVLAGGRASFAGSGDACNFFSLALAGATAPDARADSEPPACRTDADCADPFPCTEDTCASTSCRHRPASGQCFVGGACFAAGAVDPSNPCQRCEPAAAQLAFTAFPGKGCVTTVAGGGLLPSYADGPAAAAKFHSPEAVAVDSSGAIYVADSGNSCIRKIAGGMVTTVAGTAQQEGLRDGPASVALFCVPDGVALSPLDGLVVADRNNHALRRLDLTSLVVSTLLGDGASGFADGPASTARMYSPGDLAVGPAGLYVADVGNHSIRLVANDAARTVSTVAGSGTPGFQNGPAAMAQFAWPEGVAVLGSTVLVADTGNDRIRHVRSDSAGTAVFTLAGSEHGYRDGPGDEALFANPAGLVVGGSGASFTLYVADRDNHRIRKVAVVLGSPPSVVVSTLAGDGTSGYRDGVMSTAQFDQPTSIAIDSAGQLYVADLHGDRIRLITP
jgi:sugar lactone lactonase YvrE